MKIGVDVGGSHVGIGIVNATGNLLLKKEKDYDKKQDDMSNIVLNTIIEIIKEIIQENNINLDRNSIPWNSI